MSVESRSGAAVILVGVTANASAIIKPVLIGTYVAHYAFSPRTAGYLLAAEMTAAAIGTLISAVLLAHVPQRRFVIAAIAMILIGNLGDEIFVDTEGSAPQQVGPINCPLATTIGFVRMVMKMIVAPEYTANEGFFRPLKLNIPEGSVLNPVSPAPVFLYSWSAFPMGDAMFKAFAQATPSRSVARSGGDIGGLLFSWKDRLSGAFVAGGWDESVGQGASIDEDGESALVHYSLGESRNVPIEVAEQRYPIQVECYELWNDSAGPGRFRGGLGVRKFWKALDEMRLIAVIEQTQYPAWGLEGGGSATANLLMLKAGTPEARRTGKISGYAIQPGERIELYMGGGGGWGDAFERDPQSVLSDVVARYVSREAAERDYGVVIHERGEDRFEIDLAATQRLRGQRPHSGLLADCSAKN